MPKVLNKISSALRESKVYDMRRCTSEPALRNNSYSYLNLMKDYTNLLKDYETQGAIKRTLYHQLDVLKNEVYVLKKEIQNGQKVRCQVCFSKVHKNDAIHMGDCGHGACRPCFVNSVVHTAIHLRQHNDVETIQECWRCFSCREFNYSFLEYQRGVLKVKYTSYRSELGDTVLHDYRKLEKSLKLLPLSQDFQENERLQESPEENSIIEAPAMSEGTREPNQNLETSNSVRIVESDEIVEDVSTSERAHDYQDLIVQRVQTAKDLEIDENGTHFEESVQLKEITVTELVHIPNESSNS